MSFGETVWNFDNKTVSKLILILHLTTICLIRTIVTVAFSITQPIHWYTLVSSCTSKFTFLT